MRLTSPLQKLQRGRRDLSSARMAGSAHTLTWRRSAKLWLPVHPSLRSHVLRGVQYTHKRQTACHAVPVALVTRFEGCAALDSRVLSVCFSVNEHRFYASRRISAPAASPTCNAHRVPRSRHAQCTCAFFGAKSRACPGEPGGHELSDLRRKEFVNQAP